MNRSCRKPITAQPAFQCICPPLCFHKHQGQGLLQNNSICLLCMNKVHKMASLVIILNKLNSLNNQISTGTNPSNRQKYIVRKKIQLANLDLPRKCGTKKHSLPFTRWGHIHLLHYPSDLRLKPHIQHSICLIKGQISN
nr:ATP-dependent RNA helicase [Ipomoea batatas]